MFENVAVRFSTSPYRDGVRIVGRLRSILVFLAGQSSKDQDSIGANGEESESGRVFGSTLYIDGRKCGGHVQTGLGRISKRENRETAVARVYAQIIIQGFGQNDR